MDRKQEFEKIKQLIKENYNSADGGLFHSRNVVGDPMDTLFEGEYFTLDICYHYGYFEIFGATTEELIELDEFYDDLEVE